MNTQSDAMPESLRSATAAPAVISPAGACTGRCGANCGRTARSISLPSPPPPLFLVGFLISTDSSAVSRMHAGLALTPLHQHAALVQPYDIRGA